jgi:uncharacterized protein
VTDQQRNPNRLIHEKSPYLLQHAHNPVDWYPWGEEAFARARDEGKPIFLSVGYSTCHWCHVMEEESFENPETAALMNELFVCIKVDREERPDVDKVYMTALQAMGQGGGWPMSMFLTPDLRPFYGGTYYPPESRYGRAGFPDVLRRISGIWKSERQKVDEAAANLTNFLNDVAHPAGPSAMPGVDVLDRCYEQFSRTFDPVNGGFGGAPKFPRPSVFAFLLRYYARTGRGDALAMVEKSLRAIADGGIYDHLGGGIHRYAVDAEWRVPHFEKMLYDQAQIVIALVETFLATGDSRYATIAHDVLSYVRRDLTAPGGAFFSAEDADSPRPEAPGERGEGAFYVWTKKEILDRLEPGDGAIVAAVYGVKEKGNAPVDPQLEFAGRNILHRALTIADAAREFGKSEQEIEAVLERGRTVLFAERNLRPEPSLDDKILTSWNGMMISAFARAFQAFGEPTYLKVAEHAMRFVLGHLSDPSRGTLYRRFRDGEARYDGNLEDYAMMVQALLDLYESSFDLTHLEDAVRITEAQVRLFWDESSGAFFDTPGTDPSILVRLKELYDGAEPTGNAIAALNLLRLSHMTGRSDWRSMAERMFSFSSGVMNQQPVAMPYMVAALVAALQVPIQVVLAGRRDDPDAARILREIRRAFLPAAVIALADPAERPERLAAVLPFAARQPMVNGKATAYICRNLSCELPTGDVAQVRMLLDKVQGSGT